MWGWWFYGTSRWAWTGCVTTAAATATWRTLFVFFRTLLFAFLRRFLRFFALLFAFVFPMRTTFWRWASISSLLFLVVTRRIFFCRLTVPISISRRCSTNAIIISASWPRSSIGSCICLTSSPITFIFIEPLRTSWSLLSLAWASWTLLPLLGATRALQSLPWTSWALSSHWTLWSWSASIRCVWWPSAVSCVWWISSGTIEISIVSSWRSTTSRIIVSSSGVFLISLSVVIVPIVAASFHWIFVVGEIQSIIFAAVFDDQTASFATPLYLRHRLWEINVNAAIVN